MKRIDTSPLSERRSEPGLSPVSPGHSPLSESITMQDDSFVIEQKKGLSVPPPFRPKILRKTDFSLEHLKLALEHAGIDSKKIDVFATDLQKKIQNSNKAVADYKGDGQRISSKKPEINYWISRKENKIEIELIGPEIAQGTLKIVHLSSVLTLDLDKPLESRAEIQKTVTIRIMPEAEEEEAEDLNQMLTVSEFVDRSLEMQQELKKAFGDDLADYNIANLYEKTEGGARETEDGTIELRDVRYQSDWSTVLRTETNPDVEQRVQIIRSIAHSLQGLHEHGFVHGDVKAENVYLDDRSEAKLGDLDTLGYIGGESQGATLPDAIHDKLNILTPFTDIYALALMTESALKGLDDRYEKEIEAVKQENKKIKKLLEHKDEHLMDILEQNDFAALDEKFPAYAAFMKKIKFS